MSASMVVAPVLAGILFEINHVAPYILAILVLLAGLVELWMHPQKGAVAPAAGAPRENSELPGS
jgi:MFS-type transporter involved in bile tolerance (Atg22 family)